MAETKTKTQETSKRTVAILGATYFAPETDLAGKDQVIVRSAGQGDEIELVPSEEARLDALGALEPKDGESGVAAEEKLLRYRAQRGDREALQTIIDRGVNPADNVPPAPGGGASMPTVSPPSMGVTPTGDYTTGDTGAADTPPVATEGTPPADEQPTYDATGKTASEIGEWITSEKPNVATTVAAAKGDAATAATILEAEQLATGGDSRTTVVEGLQKVIDEGQSE